MTVIYVASARSAQIRIFSLESTGGRLDLIDRVGTPPGLTPLALSPDGRFLYAGLRGEQPAVMTFAIAPRTGLLDARRRTALVDAPMYLATDARGRFLLCASYAGASFCILPIDGDGGVGESPTAAIDGLPFAHAAITDPTNAFACVTSLGSDRVYLYRFDAATGRVRPTPQRFVETPLASGPRHIVFSPGGERLYVNGELDGCVYTFAFDRSTGDVRALDHQSMLIAPGTGGWTAEVARTPDGRHLYVTDRRTNTIAVFACTADGLRRTAIVATETQPRSFLIDPTGRFLLLAGELSDHLTVYAIDTTTGALEPRHRYAVGEKPVWVVAAEL